MTKYVNHSPGTYVAKISTKQNIWTRCTVKDNCHHSSRSYVTDNKIAMYTCNTLIKIIHSIYSIVQ